MLQVGVPARVARPAGSVAFMILVTLRVLLVHHEGARAYSREVDWPMPLPAPGELVALGPGLLEAVVERRVFVPDGERVVLMFKVGPTDSATWPAALEAAGYDRVEDPDDPRRPRG